MRGRGRRREVALLARGPRRSLPKALVVAGEPLEAAAVRAAETWTGCAVAVDGPAGAVLIAERGRTLCAWFQRVHVVAEGPEPALPAGWRLLWRPPAEAARELAQADERALVERVLVQPERALAARLAALLPAERRGRRLAGALALSAALAPLAAWRGWLSGAAFGAQDVPRFALCAFAGGLSSAALRGGDDDPALVGGLAGAIVGTLAAALVAGGALTGVAVPTAGALVVAWLGGFGERALLRVR